MAVAAVTILVVAPTGNEAGWVWPPAILALVAWMVVRSRRALRSRARVVVLYPVFAALALSALGGAYETYLEATDSASTAMPGRLVDVGGHKLHIDCTGTGSPTVVLEPGMGEISTMMAAWIAPDVASTTRVCVYDRAGRGWSESADGPQDGVEVATDLHTLLVNGRRDRPVRARRALRRWDLHPQLRPPVPRGCRRGRAPRLDAPRPVRAHAVMARVLRDVPPSIRGHAVAVTSRCQPADQRGPVRRAARPSARPGARAPVHAPAQPQRPRRVQPDPHRHGPGRPARHAR